LKYKSSLLEYLVSELKAKYQFPKTSEDQTSPKVGRLREWQKELNLEPNWYGWSALGNFIRLRHCFAHEFGNLLARQQIEVENFLRQLRKGSILDKNGRPISEIFNSGKGKESLYGRYKICQVCVKKWLR